ncbi:response regulator [Prolixibacteraceae bacterium JC049]|nr:response regulator [Prolixibacteraceae bacterium JC049]
MKPFNSLISLIILILLSIPSFAQDSISADAIHSEFSRHQTDSIIRKLVKQKKQLKERYAPQLRSFKAKFNQMNNTYGVMEIDFQLGLNYRYQYAYDSAMIYYSKSLKVASELKVYRKMGRLNNEMGLICRKSDRNFEAIQYYLAAIETVEESKNYFDKAIAENGIGNIYLVQAEYRKALKYFNESMKYGLNRNNNYHLEISYGNLGEVYSLLQQPDSANYYINKSLKLAKKRKSTVAQGICYQLLGKVQVNTKNYDKAYKLYIKALEFQRIKNDKRYLSAILVDYGALCVKLKKYNEAEKSLLEAQKLATNIHSLEQLVILYSALSEMYRAQSQFQLASNAQQMLLVHKDSLFNTLQTTAINNLEFNYQTKEKEQQIELLATQNQLIEQSKISQQRLFFVTIVLLVFLLFVLYYRIHIRKKVIAERQKMNQLKSNFFGNISHEFRTPLTLISGPVEQYLEKAKNETDQRNFESILRNTNRLLTLVDQLLEISKIDAGKIQIKAAKNDISKSLWAIASAFQYHAQQKNISYTIQIDDSNECWYDYHVIETIVLNLLSNAFKFVPNDGNVTISYHNKNHLATISVANTSKQISEEQIQNIFQRFHRLDENTQGMGIGLALVKEFAHLYRANIEANFNENQEIVFTFSFNTSKKHFSEAELVTDSINLPKVAKVIDLPAEQYQNNAEQEQPSNKPVLLLVEDNADMRRYIKEIIGNDMDVIEAENGKIGLQLAIAQVPDIILSDLMMPEMDGLELCNALKQNDCTQHIPVVLLTAKSDQDDVVKGLQQGANDYISKPFNRKALKIKLNNMLLHQQQMQSVYRNELEIKPLELVFPSSEMKFAQNVQKVIQEFITNSDFSVDQFCTEMGLSRTQLHRKLKALTGHSATAFIRSQRVKMAAEMLKSSPESISEIGYQVGFNDASYFSKCFKEEFNCTPSEYFENNKQ